MPNSKKACHKIDWSKEIVDWAQSKEGERELEEADRDSLRTINELRKALVIDKEMIHTAFTL